MTPGGGLYEANVKRFQSTQVGLTWTTESVAQVRPLVRGAKLLQPAAITKRQMLIAGHDDVVDQLYVHQTKRGLELVSKPTIRL